MKEKSEYEIQAEDFLKKTNTTFKADFVRNGKHFTDDKEDRDIYEITLTRGERVYKFDFGQSINDSGFKIINTNTDKEIKYIFLKECMAYALKFERKEINKKGFNHKFAKPGNQKEAFKSFALDKLSSMKGLTIKEPIMPTAYDTLTCLTKHEVGEFKDFCDEFGYDNDSRKAETTYKAVLEEYKNVCMLWNEKELEQLREIQ